MCSRACSKEVTLSHLFFDCAFFRVVRHDVARWLGFSFVPPRDATAHAIQFGGSLSL
ncbi:hypothetical protein A2U01_0059873, partial [Trifolium medium]|nr:hypothetical protein [Trifolium medium]